jgi:hypothetical protein
MVLVKGKVAERHEPVGIIICDPGWPQHPHRVGPLMVGKTFSCGGKKYIVVDITRNRMLIKDAQTEEEITVVPVAPGPPVAP